MNTNLPYFERIRRPRTGYGPVAAVVYMLLIYFMSQIFAAVFVGFGAVIFGYDPQKVLSDLTTSVKLQFIYIFIVEAITLYAIWIFLKIRSVPWKDIGLGRRPKLKDLGTALIIFVFYFAALLFVTGVISQVFPGLNTDQKQEIGFDSVSTSLDLVLVFVSLVILPPLVEEIMVRGFLYTGLRSKYNKIISAVVASLLFGMAHLQLGSGNPPLWIAAVDTTMLSLFLIFLREKTGALYAGMLVHAMKNGLAFLALFVVK